MKTVVLIRFDIQMRQDVSVKLGEFVVNNDVPKIIQTPSTVITFFKTEYPFKEIYKSLATLRPITAFLLIDVSKTDVSIHLPKEITEELASYLNKNIIDKVDYEDTSKMSLDELNHHLQNAVNNDNFEKAAEIRDIINLHQNQGN